MYLSLNKVSSSSSKQHEARILMCGLDAAGKTSIGYAAKFGEVEQTMPTIGLDLHTVSYGNLKLAVWELGGRGKMRALWHLYYKNTSALIFVVDSNDLERLSDACEELHRMANEDELRNRPILIFANKQDLPNSQSLDVLKEELKLTKLDEMKTKWHLQSSVATKNEGIHEGFEWLVNAVQTKFDAAQPIIETINDTKAMKSGLSSLWNSINFKILLSKFLSYENVKYFSSQTIRNW